MGIYIGGERDLKARRWKKKYGGDFADPQEERGYRGGIVLYLSKEIEGPDWTTIFEQIEGTSRRERKVSGERGVTSKKLDQVSEEIRKKWKRGCRPRSCRKLGWVVTKYEAKNFSSLSLSRKSENFIFGREK